MNRLREKFQHFMIGRYGMDQLGQFSAYAVLALLLLNVVIRRRLPSLVLEVLTFAGILLMYFRMFSRNINRRYQENQVFCGISFTLRNTGERQNSASQRDVNTAYSNVLTVNRRCGFPKAMER